MKRLIVLLVVVPAVALAGTAVAAKSPLTGTWQTTVKSPVPVFKGTWQIIFTPDGAYTVVKKPNTSAAMVNGTSTVAGTTLTMNDKNGPASCPGSTARARYGFKIKGKTLRLTKISEPCTGRAVILAGTFTKVG